MKKSLMFMAGAATAGIASYIMMNKKTRKKAEELFNSMMDEADKTIKNISN